MLTIVSILTQVEKFYREFQERFSQEVAELILLYGLFLTGTFWILWVPLRSLWNGGRMNLIVLGFHLLLLGVIFLRKRWEWLHLWWLVSWMGIGMALVLGWVSAESETIIYPADAAPFWGNAPRFLFGFWPIVLFALLIFGRWLQEQFSPKVAITLFAGCAMIIVACVEQFASLIPIWYVQNVAMLAGTPLFILIANTAVITSLFWGDRFLAVFPWRRAILLAIPIALIPCLLYFLLLVCFLIV